MSTFRPQNTLRDRLTQQERLFPFFLTPPPPPSPTKHPSFFFGGGGGEGGILSLSFNKAVVTGF